MREALKDHIKSVVEGIRHLDIDSAADLIAEVADEIAGDDDLVNGAILDGIRWGYRAAVAIHGSLCPCATGVVQCNGGVAGMTDHIDTSPEAVPLFRVQLHEAVAERDRLRALTPAAMLDVYDRFMAGGSITDSDRKQVDHIASAAAFGAAAYEAGMDADQGTHAMMRSIMLAMVDPTHPDLDYLRADPEAAGNARAALERTVK